VIRKARVHASRNVLVAFAVTAAIAEAQVVADFDLPSQSLADSLRAVAGQTSSNIIFDRSLVAGLSAPPLQVRTSAEDALTKLLRGTGLTWRHLDEKTVTIVAADEGAAATPAGAARSQTTVPRAHLTDDGIRGGMRLARADQESGAAASGSRGSSQSESGGTSAESLEEVVVTGVNFNYNEVQSASKMPMSIKDTPQSVKVVTLDMLNFASVSNFNEVYKLDAGTYTAQPQDGYSWSFFRGFKTGFEEAFKVDGFRVLGRVQLDLAPYERMEIVKGSTSTMYGQSSVAGTLNAISKKPMAEFGGSMGLEVGSYGHYRADLDVHGALTADEKLTYRFVGAYLDEDSFVDYAYRKQIVVAPSLKYEFSPATSVLLQVNYQNFDYLPLEGYPPQFQGGDPGDLSNYRYPDVPRSRFGGVPWANADREAIFSRIMLEHSFANDWMLRSNLQYSNIKGLVKRNRLQGADEAGVSPMYIYFDDSSDPVYSAEVNLFGDVELFGRKHTLFFGADFADLETETKGGYAYLPGDVLGFNILDPDYSLIPAVGGYGDFAPGGLYNDLASSGGGYAYFWGGTYKSQRMGATAQALLHPTDKLSLLLGTRYSRSTEETNQGVVPDWDTLNPYTKSPNTNHWTFQTGATYAITPAVNVYATYGETFEPRIAFAFDPGSVTGRDLGPEEGETYEVGFKGELFERKFSWSVDYFQTARTNVVEPDPDNPQFMIELGEQRGKGVELDFQGELVPGWDVYSSVVSMENDFTEGNLAGVPSPFNTKFGVSFFTSYELQGGALRGLGFGGGVVHKQREDYFVGQLAYPDLFGDYTEVDLRVFYASGPWRYQVTATNIFNEKYFSTFQQQWLGCCQFVNPPRQVFGSITRKF
jgi:iron complex outermembrane receptor protein